GDREALAGASAPGSDDERGALRHNGLEIDRLELAGLIELIRDGCVALAHVAQERTALLAVVRPLGVHKAALRTVHARPVSRRSRPRRCRRACPYRRGCP